MVAARIAGEESLRAGLNAAEVVRAVERCRHRAERAIESNLGALLSAGGNHFVAVFQKADHAVLAALEMRDRVAQLPPLCGNRLAIGISVQARSLQAGKPIPDHLNDVLDTAAETAGDRIEVSRQVAQALSRRIADQLAASGSCQMIDTPLSGEAPFVPPVTSLAANQGSHAEPARPADPSAQHYATPTGRQSMLLRHHSADFILSDSRPILLAGREEGNDLVIHDRRASRHHARIEWRQNRFVLVDTSSNGTYLVDPAGQEVVLRRAEADLPDQGRIGFGFAPLDSESETAVFSLSKR